MNPTNPSTEDSVCPTCDGRGVLYRGTYNQNQYKCHVCHGTGRIPTKAEYKETFPSTLTTLGTPPNSQVVNITHEAIPSESSLGGDTAPLPEIPTKKAEDEPTGEELAKKLEELGLPAGAKLARKIAVEEKAREPERDYSYAFKRRPEDTISNPKVELETLKHMLTVVETYFVDAENSEDFEEAEKLRHEAFKYGEGWLAERDELATPPDAKEEETLNIVRRFKDKPSQNGQPDEVEYEEGDAKIERTYKLIPFIPNHAHNKWSIDEELSAKDLDHPDGLDRFGRTVLEAEIDKLFASDWPTALEGFKKLIRRSQSEYAIKVLTDMKIYHGNHCGVVRVDNPRDECAYLTLVDQAISDERGKL